VTRESVTFVHEGTTLFEEPTSSLREASPIGRAGRPTGFFRIAFSNGKIYNFRDPKANSPDRSSYLMLKKALLGSRFLAAEAEPGNGSAA
jgi:hypothetical protein